MRKAIYLGAAFAAVMTTSCSNDLDQFDATRGDGNVAVRLQLPDNFATRAFGDGYTATRIQYAVYHSGEKAVVTSGTTTFSDREAILNLDLVNGMTYDFVFWADQPDNEFYTFDADNQTITVDYNSLEGNDENRDAFFGQLTEQEITGPTSLTATLKRPFAQINLGTSDFNMDAVVAAYPNFNSSMTISTMLPTTLNLLDGNVSGETTANVATTSESRPNGETFPVEGFEYVSMNYILVDATKDVIDLTYSFKNNDTEVSNISVASVPVQRNYRTNIYGAVLTSPTDLFIKIDPIFETPDYNQEVVVVKTVEEFIDALVDEKVVEIKVTSPLDLTEVDADGMVITTPKVLDLTTFVTRAGEASITINPEIPFDIRSSLTVNGGLLTNGQEDLGEGKSAGMFFVKENGELNLNGVRIEGNLNHHYHGQVGFNSAIINYLDNAVINITDSHIVTGEFVVCGLRTVYGLKYTFTNSYMESTSSSLNNGTYWSYALKIHGGEAIFKDCTVVGVQGGVSGGNEATIIFESGNYYTQNTPGKTDAYYAVYMTGGATAIINDGYYYGANKQSNLAGEGGTSAVVSGDNDTDKPLGNIVINGGYFSGVPYNHVTNTIYEPADGLQFKGIEETVDGRKYLWTVQTAE